MGVLGARVVLVLAGWWLGACLGPELQLNSKIRQEPVSERRPLVSPSLTELDDFVLIARLPPREKQLSGTGGGRLHEVAQEIGRRAREGQLSERAWVELLVREDVIHTRPRWPTNMPLGISIRRPTWISPKRITVEAIDPPLGTVDETDLVDLSPLIDCLIDAGEMGRGDDRRQLGALPAGTRVVTFEVRIEGMTNPWSPYSLLREKPQSSWKGRLKVPIDAVGRAEDCLPAAFGAEIDAAVRESLHAGFQQGSVEPLVLGLHHSVSTHPILAGVGLSLVVELLKDGQLSEQTSLRAGGQDLASTCQLESIPRRFAEGPDRDRWQLRIRGEPAGVLALWEAESYWTGELTIPLAELIERGR